jgi:hypothetical protein
MIKVVSGWMHKSNANDTSPVLIPQVQVFQPSAEAQVNSRGGDIRYDTISYDQWSTDRYRYRIWTSKQPLSTELPDLVAPHNDSRTKSSIDHSRIRRPWSPNRTSSGSRLQAGALHEDHSPS